MGLLSDEWRRPTILRTKVYLTHHTDLNLALTAGPLDNMPCSGPPGPSQRVRGEAARCPLPRSVDRAQCLEVAVSLQPGHRLGQHHRGAGHALQPSALFTAGCLIPFGCSGRAGRRNEGAAVPDRARHRRQRCNPGRSLQRHDRPARRHLRRPGATRSRAQPAAGTLGAAGQRGLPGGGGGEEINNPLAAIAFCSEANGAPPARTRPDAAPPTPRSSASTCA